MRRRQTSLEGITQFSGTGFAGDPFSTATTHLSWVSLLADPHFRTASALLIPKYISLQYSIIKNNCPGRHELGFDDTNTQEFLSKSSGQLWHCRGKSVCVVEEPLKYAGGSLFYIRLRYSPPSSAPLVNAIRPLWLAMPFFLLGPVQPFFQPRKGAPKF